MTLIDAAKALDEYAGDAADMRPPVGGYYVPNRLLADLRAALRAESIRHPNPPNTAPWEVHT